MYKQMSRGPRVGAMRTSLRTEAHGILPPHGKACFGTASTRPCPDGCALAVLLPYAFAGEDRHFIILLRQQLLRESFGTSFTSARMSRV